MKIRNRLLALLLTAALCVSLSGCAIPAAYINMIREVIHEGQEGFEDGIGDLQQELEREFSQEFGSGATGEINGETDTGSATDPSDAEQTKPTAEPETGSESSQGSGDPSQTSEDSQPQETNRNVLDSPYIPPYEHYEKSRYEALCEELKEAGKNNDAEKIEETAQALLDDLIYISTMAAVAFVYYAEDVNNTYYEDEYSYTDLLYTDCFDLYMLACQEVEDSPGKENFEKLANPLIVEKCREYDPLTDRARELLEEETRLENEYNKLLDASNELTYTFKGVTYRVQDLYDDDSALNALVMFHYSDFLQVYEGLLEAMNASLGPVFLELLPIRKELAEEFGYETYADYAYENVFGRGYTTKDAEQYCEMIKEKVGEKFYESAYYELYNSSSFTTEFTYEEMLDIVDRSTADMDEVINDSLHIMRENNLCDMGEGEGRYQGSFTINLDSSRVPFVFCNNGSDLDALATVTHEFGHFVDMLYEDRDPYACLRTSNYDVMEIHSNGLQLMCANRYGEITENTWEAEEAIRAQVANQLNSVVDGCIFDEFQRRIYEDPDKYTDLDSLNRLYSQTLTAYGENLLPGSSYLWVLVNHNFESPMYYISYSISALSALEIWLTSLEDNEKAVEIWMSVMEELDDMDYEEVMEKAGLTPFTDLDGSEQICLEAMEKLNSIKITDGGIAA